MPIWEWKYGSDKDVISVLKLYYSMTKGSWLWNNYLYFILSSFIL